MSEVVVSSFIGGMVGLTIAAVLLLAWQCYRDHR